MSSRLLSRCRPVRNFRNSYQMVADVSKASRAIPRVSAARSAHNSRGQSRSQWSRAQPRTNQSKRLLVSLAVAATASACAVAMERELSAEEQPDFQGISSAVGNTPLFELTNLSAELGQDVHIVVKLESSNPGGSVKDRAAKYMIEEAEQKGLLDPSRSSQYTIVEGTGGNTGVGLAMLAAAKGYKSIMCMPSKISPQKQDTMRAFGAEVVLCPAVPFGHPEHYFETAKRLASENEFAVWTNQFENTANAKSHFETTGPEIWSGVREMGYQGVDGVALSAGTGGTIAGLSQFFKAVDDMSQDGHKTGVYLIDCPGSSLHNYVQSGELQPGIGGTKVYEGVGIGRLTANFLSGHVTGSFQGTDREGVEMCHYLLRNEGLWVGPSAALNVVGAVKLARLLKSQRASSGNSDGRNGKAIVIATIACDGGERYTGTVYDPSYLAAHDLTPQSSGKSLDFVQ